MAAWHCDLRRGGAWDSVTRLLAGLVDRAVDRSSALAHQNTMAVAKAISLSSGSVVELNSDKAVESNPQVANRKGCKVKDKSISKAIDKEVGKSSSTVTHEGSSRTEEQSRSKSSGGKISSAWVEEASLPAGWRSCVPAPGRPPLYYSPCGNLFTSSTQVEKFLAKSATVSKIEERTRGETVAKPRDNDDVLEDAVYRCEVEMGEEEVIVLSDEELDLPEGNTRKRRPSRSPALTPTKRRRTGKTLKRAKENENMAEKQKVSKELKRGTKGTEAVAERQERMTEEQEAVLLAAFREWPVGFPELAAALAGETGLGEAKVAAWFVATRTECLHLLWQ